MNSALTQQIAEQHWQAGMSTHLQLGLGSPIEAGDDLITSNSSVSDVVQQMERQMETHRREQDDAISKLKQLYVLVNPDQVTSFLNYHQSLPHLLLEAAPQIGDSFGIDTLIKLELSEIGDEPATLRATVLWPGSVEDGNAALNAFDQNYWIANCNKASGKLVIDRELV